MATTLPGSSKIVSAKARLISAPLDRRPRHGGFVRLPRAAGGGRRGRLVIAAGAGAGPSTPPEILEKMAESIKNAEETCAEDAASGECAAAWDEVEELSAAASHARDKLKEGDPLEKYCADNPETVECRTYED